MNSFERDGSADLDTEFPDLPHLGQLLSPPPSPLGDEFAKRTAALVLKRANETSRREFLRPTATSKFASFGKDNPALTLFSRETARNTLKPLQAAAVLLLYSVPAAWLYQMPSLGVRPYENTLSNAEIYFWFLFASLCFAVPLYLFTQTYAFYSRLIQGRAIEEILLTHIQPAELADSLLASSMRKVLPLIGLMTLSLLPTIYLDHHWSFFAWPLQSIVICIFGCSVLQVYALRQGESQSKAGLFGLLSSLVALVLAQWFPLHAVWSCGLMLGLAFYCRKQSILALSALQVLKRSPQEFVEKKTAKSVRQPAGRLEQWLRGKFSDYPLVYRELGRSRLYSAVRLLINPATLLASYFFLFDVSRGGRANFAGWAFLLTVLFCYLDSARLFLNEKSSGSFDLLVQGGLTEKDFVQSSFCLGLLRLFPSCLLLTGFSVRVFWESMVFGNKFDSQVLDFSVLAALGLGVALTQVVAIWCGASLGTRSSLTASSWRSNAAALLSDTMMIGVTSLILIAGYAVLSSEFGTTPAIDLLCLMLAARLAAASDVRNWFGAKGPFAPWAMLLLPAFPAALLTCAIPDFLAKGRLPSWEHCLEYVVCPLMWLFWVGRKTRTVQSFSSSQQLRLYAGWVCSYGLFCLTFTALIHWLPVLIYSYSTNGQAGGSVGLAVLGYCGVLLLLVALWAVVVAVGLANWGSPRPTNAPQLVDRGFGLRTAVLSGLTLLVIASLGRTLYRSYQLLTPLSESERKWIQTIPDGKAIVADDQISASSRLARLSEADTRPSPMRFKRWDRAWAAKLRPLVLEQERVFAELNHRMDFGFDQRNHLRPEISSGPCCSLNQDCLEVAGSLWKLGETDAAIGALSFPVRQAQLSLVNYRSNISEVYRFGVEMVESRQLNLVQLSQLESALEPLHSVANLSRRRYDSTIGRWYEPYGMTAGLSIDTVLPNQWSTLVHAAMRQQVTRTYLKLRANLDSDETSLSQPWQVQDPVRSGWSYLETIEEKLYQDYVMRDTFALVLKLERTRLEEGAYPTRLVAKIHPSLQFLYRKVDNDFSLEIWPGVDRTKTNGGLTRLVVSRDAATLRDLPIGGFATRGDRIRIEYAPRHTSY